jgi:nanoRNase/pAp phosphatase (c-di-AMP/oligoRNAs hydrolase)
MYPKKTLILYTKSGSIWKISGRSRKHDVGELFKKATKDIGTGGGHPVAAGADVNDIVLFKKRIMKLI